MEAGVDLAEISDGVFHMDVQTKCEYVDKLSKDLTVISEVGSKIKEDELTNDEWIASMKAELDAGSWKVIAEARESGNMGIYNSDGSANTELIEMIENVIGAENVIWEAPAKKSASVVY